MTTATSPLRTRSTSPPPAPQRAWLADLATADGLRLANYLPRRWTYAVYDRITAFLTKLWAAGYDIHYQAGPRGTWHLIGYRPEQAIQRQVLTKLGYDLQFTTGTGPHRWEPAALLALLKAENLQTLQNATDLLTRTDTLAWTPLPFHVPIAQAPAEILHACRAADAHAGSRGRQLAQLLNDAHRRGQRMTLTHAAQIADCITDPVQPVTPL